MSMDRSTAIGYNYDENQSQMNGKQDGTLLVVRKVHSQLLFASENNFELASRGYILINFLEAVDGMGLYCADLTDYIRPGDIAMAKYIDKEGDVPYAKCVVFDFDAERGLINPADDYFKGMATVEHVGEWFAGIRADDPNVDPNFRELLVPITALTKDSIPVGCRISDVRMTDLISCGDKVAYKVPRNPIDEGLREKHKVASARKFAHVSHLQG